MRMREKKKILKILIFVVGLELKVDDTIDRSSIKEKEAKFN